MTGRDTPVLTVSQLNEFVRMMLDNTPVFQSVYVRGEISNFVNHRSGHFYFSLKDQESLLKSVMFRASASRLRFLPENGMKVIVHGRVSCFTRDGVYQLYADDIQPDGIGALYLAYEQLKSKLAAEGLFDEANKKPLPAIPTRIGVITSPTGAAVRDIISITGRRFPAAKLILFPALVQGDGAAAQLAEGIRYFNREGTADVIIIGRGGGSLEDLWAFNDETLAREIAASGIPVISAVGHETDYTICDFAADRRAPTPSGAAELAVPDRRELAARMPVLAERMRYFLTNRLAHYRTEVDRMAKSRALTVPEAFLDDKRMALGNADAGLERAMSRILSEKRKETVSSAKLLDAVNPLRILTRGYAAVFDGDGNAVTSVTQVEEGDLLLLRISDGRLSVRTENIEKEEGLLK